MVVEQFRTMSVNERTERQTVLETERGTQHNVNNTCLSSQYDGLTFVLPNTEYDDLPMNKFSVIHDHEFRLRC